ncbi:ribonuclease HII [Candidatus Roizmanbacteria bacterium]|nr:ribonuclease HII [Candidatus Roizmanbacteria bacterium]
MQKLPDFSLEKKLWSKGYIVIGVDEVGRGALAGPLYVGAVCFRHTILKRSYQDGIYPDKLSFNIENIGINDSKKLTARKREELATFIKKVTLAYSVSSVNVRTLNRLGIVKATEKAIRNVIFRVTNSIGHTTMHRSADNGIGKAYILLDAFYVKYIKGVGLKNQKAIIQGDEKSISIAAASIIAKIERDHNMIKLHHKYPIYFWKNNKGYGTKEHIEAIKKFGKSKLHRDMFLRKILK